MTKFDGKRLKRARLAKGWTVPDLVFELARKGFRISAPSIQAYENGARVPGSDKVALLAEIFGLELGYFFAKNVKKDSLLSSKRMNDAA